MYNFTNRRHQAVVYLIAFTLIFSIKSYASDSDVVNCNHAWKIVILGSSTSYGMGASTYDSSWAGRFTTYLKSKNTANQVINFGTPGFKTYQNLRPTGYIPPQDRPYPSSDYNITAALALQPDAIIINMPSNDAVNGYSIAEQQANFEAALYLADSAHVPVWVTTTQPRNYLTTDQANNLIQTRAWILSRFGNKAVDFWESVANADGSINTYYDYDYAHVNNIGHNLFFTRMRAECILDTLCNRLIPPCNFSVGATITGNSNVCGNMGIGDSAVFSITSTDATGFSWSVSNAATMGISPVRNSGSVKIKFASTFTTGTITLAITGCNGTVVTRTLAVSKTVPGAPSAITNSTGGSAVTYICPFIGSGNITYVAAPPATNAAAVIAYRWTLPSGAQLVSVNRPDSSSITISFPAAPTTLVLSVISVSGCGNSAAKSITLNKTAPAAPLSISGLTDICASVGSASQTDNIIYSISAVNNAASYLWTVPTGATLISGQGSTSINVVFSTTFVSGNITVQSLSPCGNSVAKTLTVYKRVAAAPALIQKEFSPVSIAAVTNVCGLSTETYRIRKVTYATSYDWTFTNGTKANITHLNAPGIDDTAITVTLLSGFTKDTLSVKAVTACNISAAKTIILNATLLPPTPTAINSGSGNYNPCIGNQVTYTVVSPTPTTAQASPVLFRWTKPNNTVIIAASGDSSFITLQFNSGYTGGSITVKGQTACGLTGTAKSVSLQYLPPTPSAITSGTGIYNACIGDVVSYSVVVSTPTATQIAAIGYRWTRPNYTSILSANADSSVITISFNSGYIGGNLTVKGQTPCGNFGTVKSQALTHTGCASGTKMTTSLAANQIITQTAIYPNPNNGSFSIRFNKESGCSEKQIGIYDMSGRLQATYQAVSNPENFKKFNCKLAPGVYHVVIRNNQQSETLKMVITE